MAKLVGYNMQVRASLLLISVLILLSFNVNPVFGQQNAQDFMLVDLDGHSFTLSECPARVVLLDFFGTQCPPCVTEIPVLRSLYHEYSRDELEIISISPEGDATLRDFAQQHNMEWIVANDPGGGVSDAYGIYAIPRTFLVDAQNYIRYDHTGWSGADDESELRSQISSVLSGTSNGGNGDSNGDADTGQTGPPYTLIAIIGGAVIIFLIIGIVAAGQLLGWSESPKKRRSHKGKG
jgi:peroxiredoxin